MRLLDTTVDIQDLKDAFTNMDAFKLMEENQDYEFCLTSSDNDPFFTRFKHSSTDVRYEQLPKSNDVNLLTGLTGTRVESMMNKLYGIIEADGLTPGRWYLQRIAPVAVTPFRVNPLTQYVIVATNHRCAMLVTDESAASMTEGQIHVIESGIKFSHYNGHMARRSTILIMEAYDEN